MLRTWINFTGNQSTEQVTISCENSPSGDASYLFDQVNGFKNIDISNLNLSLIDNASYMFNYCANMNSINMNGINMCNVTNLNCAFYYLSSLNSINIDNMNVQNCVDLSHMLHGIR